VLFIQWLVSFEYFKQSITIVKKIFVALILASQLRARLDTLIFQ
jgi:hypothetical protein